MDPETVELDTDVVETGTSQTQRDRIKQVRETVDEPARQNMEGEPLDDVLDRLQEEGMTKGQAEKQVESVRTDGELYNSSEGYLRTT